MKKTFLYLGDSLLMDYGRFQQLAGLQSGNINDYIAQLTRFLEEKSERLNKSLEDAEIVDKIEVTESHMIELMEDLVKWSDLNSKQFIYNALFIKTNSFLEWGLTECCRLAGIYANDSFFEYKTRDKGIDKARSYLKEKMNIPIDAGSKEWSRFKINQDIRNVIVHNGSNIVVDHSKDVGEQPLFKMIVTNKKAFYLTEDTGFVYINDISYIQESHNWATDFVQNILDAVRSELIRNRSIQWT